MNIDEAHKWLEIAKKAIHNQEYDKAIRFLHKSKKLHESHEADGLIKLWEMNLANRNGSKTNQAPNATDGPHKRTNTKKPAEDEKERPKNYTAEDVKLCNQILGKTNYYEILGVEKKAAENEIKKAYKKLALKLHPDKNNAPKATDAFKKVATAYSCLTDEKKRQIYDEHGTEDNFRQNYHQYFREEEEIDPFDIFEMFVGPGFGNRVNRRRRQQHHHQPQAGQRQQGNPLAQLFPLLLVLIFTVVVNLGGNYSSGPSYSFVKTDTHTIQFDTEIHNVRYFVDADTHSIINNNLRTTKELEGNIERDFYRIKNKDWRNAKESYNHWTRQARYYTKGDQK